MTSVSDRFVHALRTLDAEAMAELLAPDAIAWLNLGNRSRTAEEMVETLSVERSLVRSSTLHVRHQAETGDGFLVQFIFEGTTEGGADFQIPICIVARAGDGRISRLDEYADEASTRPLREELHASAHSDSGVTRRAQSK